MRERHEIRVLITYDTTYHFIDQGQERGFEYELLREYEAFLNKGLSKRQLPTRLVFLPMPLEDLIPALVEGKGDIAAAGLTVTAE